MTKRPYTLFAAAMFALGAAAWAPAEAAQVGVNLVIGTAPPVPRFESVPVPRRGYVWVPGYWNWNGHHHIWLAGHWEAERYGYQYQPAVWVREGDAWRLDQGGWVTVETRPVAVVDYVAVPPPPPRYERIPAPRPGFIWSPGYWEWRGGRHEWITGYWVAERPGFAYREPRWVEHDGRWIREEAHWDRHGGGHEHWEHGRGDRDHDGIPNRYDHDRDGDGVPNRYDRHPDNPRRD